MVILIAKVSFDGQIKWDWSELGEWNTENISYIAWRPKYNSYVKETTPVLVWRGPIDFTYSAYTKGIRIPSSYFSNLQTGDCIAFVYSGYDFEGISDDDKDDLFEDTWFGSYGEDYMISRCSAEDLEYINEHGGLNFYATGGVLEGIFIGTEKEVTAAICTLFCKNYNYSDNKNDWEFDYTLTVDSLSNKGTINFSFTKKNSEGLYVYDENGLSHNSPDRSIYRAYRCIFDMADLNKSLDCSFLKYELVTKNDNYDFSMWTPTTTYYFREQTPEEDKFKIKFNFSKNENKDSYNLEFKEYPSDLSNYILPFQNESPVELMVPCEIESFEEPQIDDLTNETWSTQVVNSDTIKVWTRSLNYSDCEYTKGFHIPASAFANASTDTIIVCKLLDIQDDSALIAELRYDETEEDWVFIFEKQHGKNTNNYIFYVAELLTDEGLNYIKQNGLSLSCCKITISQILIGKEQAIETYIQQNYN